MFRYYHFAKVVLLVVVDWRWVAEGCQSLPFGECLIYATAPIQALSSAMQLPLSTMTMAL